MERALAAHIHSLAGRYRGKVPSWDVVNEPIEPENGFVIQITELNVIDTDAPPEQTIRDQLVANTYARFLDAELDERAVK